MGVLKISYPVTEEAKQAIAKYPAICSEFSLPASGRSEDEIVRLLSYTHYDRIQRLFELIDEWLTRLDAIGRRLIRVKHPFQFEQTLAEVFLFVHLHKFLGNVAAGESGGTPVCSDMQVKFDDFTARIEVYTPVDLIGFQLFERYVPMVLKYLDVARGYHLRVETQPVHEKQGCDRTSLYYPYTFPDQSETYAWLAEFSQRAIEWLGKTVPDHEFHMRAPGGNVEVIVKLIESSEDANERLVCAQWATRSTDTTLFFEIGPPAYTARSEWGKKLGNKLRKEQCGRPAADVLRVLVVNFAMADTGQPHFISQARFTTRFAETIRILVNGKRPYDVVLPAQLGHTCCFGEPVWLSEDSRTRGTEFIEIAELDRSYEPPPAPAPTPQEIEELLAAIHPQGERTETSPDEL